MENKIIEDLKATGFECGLAVATDAEIKAGSACGQLAAILEDTDGSN